MRPDRQRTLLALVSRILPSDDGPGATDAGVAAYIERALEAGARSQRRDMFWFGLEVVDALAHESIGCAFEACSDDERDRVIAELETMPAPEARAFFALLVRLCLEGFLCDPSHGGNRGAVGWHYMNCDGLRPAMKGREE